MLRNIVDYNRRLKHEYYPNNAESSGQEHGKLNVQGLVANVMHIVVLDPLWKHCTGYWRSVST